MLDHDVAGLAGGGYCNQLQDDEPAQEKRRPQDDDARGGALKHRTCEEYLDIVASDLAAGWPNKARRVIGGAPFDAVAGDARLRTSHASGQTMVTVARASIAPAASKPV